MDRGRIPRLEKLTGYPGARIFKGTGSVTVPVALFRVSRNRICGNVSGATPNTAGGTPALPFSKSASAVRCEIFVARGFDFSNWWGERSRELSVKARQGWHICRKSKLKNPKLHRSGICSGRAVLPRRRDIWAAEHRSPTNLNFVWVVVLQ
jgi:hypothetical protein